MRRTDQEFKAEVLRRCAAYQAERKKRREKILTTAICFVLIFTGVFVMGPLFSARGGSTESVANDGVFMAECEAPAMFAQNESAMENGMNAPEKAEPEMQDKISSASTTEESPGDLVPMVMIDGVIYMDTGYESDVQSRCGVMDGEITSQVDGSQMPTEDDQSNFGTGYGYQYGAREGTVEILINGRWFIFATEEVRQKIQFPE